MTHSPTPTHQKSPKAASARKPAHKRPSEPAATPADDAMPWKEPNPKGPGEHGHLTPSQKAVAKKRAKAAGRPYPNLVDNMHVANAAKK
jgi:hypothetical protein